MMICRECGENIPEVTSYFGGVLDGPFAICDKCATAAEQRRIDEEGQIAANVYMQKVAVQKSRIPYSDSDLSKANHKLLRAFGEAAFKDSRLSRRGIYVHGRAGLWKTRAAAFCASLACDRGHSVCWRSVPMMLSDYTRATMTNQEGAGKFISDMVRPDLLVLDDFGKGVLTARGLELLYTIIDDRFVNNKATWYTANGPPEILNKWIRVDDVGYAESILRRVNEGAEVLKA